jgi:hypothetical protein
MSFSLVVIFAGVFATWAVLSLVGGERQRRLNELEVERAAAADSSAALAGATTATPAGPAARQSTR